MKRFGVLLVMLTSFAFATNSSAVQRCTTSPNESENKGHCQPLKFGGDTCNKYGEGPACNGTVTSINVREAISSIS